MELGVYTGTVTPYLISCNLLLQPPLKVVPFISLDLSVFGFIRLSREDIEALTVDFAIVSYIYIVGQKLKFVLFASNSTILLVS